ncbi:DUF2057 domain-containing protein [Vibrio kasasachensis]|uniref:DUF2057 family protein n=1 Tax=Vibrio kasasachensis TaxID=2910248 RepID=UPI003D0EEDCA
MNKLLAVFLCLFSVTTHAKVTIKTDNRVEVLAVNQSINQIPNKGKGDLKIVNGDNQLLIRVTGLYDTNGGKRKFSSYPMVIRFNAQDEVLFLETPFAIRDERGVNKFKKSPSVKITSDAHAVEYKLDIIYDQTFELIKDYNAMLDVYNQSGGKAAILADFESQPKLNRPSQLVKKTQSKCSDAIAIEDAFLNLTPEQRQNFISWGVQHIND